MILFANQTMLIATLIVMLAFFFPVFLVFVLTASAWLRAYMSGTPLTVFTILGMRFRRTPVRKILDFLIMGTQGGVSISCKDMERAYLPGVDLEKVTMAMIQAKRQRSDIQFQELVEAELEDRLAEKLGR